MLVEIRWHRIEINGVRDDRLRKMIHGAAAGLRKACIGCRVPDAGMRIGSVGPNNNHRINTWSVAQANHLFIIHAALKATAGNTSRVMMLSPAYNLMLLPMANVFCAFPFSNMLM